MVPRPAPDRGEHRVEVRAFLSGLPCASNVVTRTSKLSTVMSRDHVLGRYRSAMMSEYCGTQSRAMRPSRVTNVGWRPSAGAPLDDRHADLVRGAGKAQAAAGDADQRLRLRPQHEVV